MIQQVGNKNIRKDLDHKSDQSFLIKFYKENGCFPQFKQVLIETRTDCNNHCPFCPHAFNKKELGIMDWNTYCKIIDELCAIGYNGRVALMLSNEPVLEDRLIDMIRYAKNKSQRLFMDITTNGRLLTVEMVDQLFANGLDNLNVNDYRGDREKNPYKLSGKLQEIYEAYNNNPKITVQYRSLNEQLPNYGGNIPQEESNEDLGFCNFPFRKLVFSYKGDILLCCSDFMYATNFGNIHERSIIECWNDSSFDKIRLSLLEGKRISLCSKCNDYQDYNTF